MHHFTQYIPRHPLTTSLLLVSLGLVGLTGCATDDPSDQDPSDMGIRDSQDPGTMDQGGTGGGGGSTDMGGGGGGGQDQGNLPVDQGMFPVDQGGQDTDQGMMDMGQDSGQGPSDMEDMNDISDMIDMPADMSDPGDMGTPGGRCRRSPETDTDRLVVIARPYDNSGMGANEYEILSLSLQGELFETGNTFSMGRAVDGEILITPDGEVGVVRQEDGSLGVFKLDSKNQTATVIDPAYAGLQAKVNPSQKRYFSTIAMAPDGSGIYASNASWRGVGGAIWFIPLDCSTGLPGQEVQITEAKLPRHLEIMPTSSSTLVVASHDVLTSMTREDAHLVNISTPTTPSLIGSGRVFMDTDAILTAMGVSRDGEYVLVGDSNITSNTNNNRVGVLSIDPQGLTPIQTLSDIQDPASIKVSPYHNAAIVTSFEGNSIQTLTYNPASPAAPFAKSGSVMTSTPVQLPSSSVMIEAGMLRGTVLVVENTGIRVLRFESSGDVTELDNLPFGEFVEAIVGAIGVQP